MTAISHSSTVASPPMSSLALARNGPTAPAVARMASSDDHDVVAMQRPVSRLASRDSPIASRPWQSISAGMTSSRTRAMHASI